MWDPGKKYLHVAKLNLSHFTVLQWAAASSLIHAVVPLKSGVSKVQSLSTQQLIKINLGIECGKLLIIADVFLVCLYIHSHITVL